MSSQGQLKFSTIGPIKHSRFDRKLSIEEQFAAFHEENQHVYKIIVETTMKLKGLGFRHFGMKAIFERLRFEYAIQTRGDEFKLNNNYTACYSRKVMEENPVLTGFFEIRTVRH